jgi:hypothetical protein
LNAERHARFGALFGFQIKCSILFGEPQAGKARLLLTKPTVLAPVRAGAIPIPDKIEAIFIRNWNYSDSE